MTTKFAQYDATDPLRKVTLNADGSLNKTAAGGDNWFLNFASLEGPLDTYWFTGSAYPAVATDGDDVIFGDLAHDWIVGGTGRDQLFGGWGDDVLNMDDVLSTAVSTSQAPDTNPSYEDLAYGGAGRDVLIANTGGDRLIDWVGEFNSYMTAFAPFGQPTKSDQQSPGLPEFLYALAKSDGADPTLAAQYGGSPARNGEPFGELGLVISTDAASGDQRGAGRDPQAGNLPGGPRDVNRTAGTHVLNSPATTVNAGGSPLRAESATLSASTDVPSVTAAELGPIVAAAKERWVASGQLDAVQLDRLARADVSIGVLMGGLVGLTTDESVTIDARAAGFGWFVDPTPLDDGEFVVHGNELVARGGLRALRQMDLLTVVMHELGHVAGYDEDEWSDGSVMEPAIAPGIRRLPLSEATAAAGLRLVVEGQRWAPQTICAITSVASRRQIVASARQSDLRPGHKLTLRPLVTRLNVGPNGQSYASVVPAQFGLIARGRSSLRPIAPRSLPPTLRKHRPAAPVQKRLKA